MVALLHYCCRTTLQCQCHVSHAKEQSQYLSATVQREHKTDVLCTESVELRRLRYDVIYVYKMLFGRVDLNFDDFTAREFV